MTARARIGRAVACCGASLAISALLLAGFIVAIGGPSADRPSTYWVETAVAGLVLSTPWLVGALLLSWARRAEASEPSAEMDPPARLLAVAAAALPEGRRDWAAAMTAELAQVQTRPARWRFALGCTRAAVFPPRSHRGPVVGAGLLGAGEVTLTWFAVGEIFPPLRVFALTFAGLVGTAAVVAVVRSRPLSRATSGPLVMAAGLTGVASCVAATWYLVDRYPTAALHLHPAAAVFLATVLAGALGLIVAPPRVLTGDRSARRIAVGVALVLGLGLLQSSRSDLRGSGTGISEYVFYVPVVAVFVTALVVAARRRSVGAGVQATVWTALLSSLGFFAIAVAEAVRWYRAHTTLILAGDAVPLDAVGESIRNFSWLLILLPLFWMPFGVIGAAIGRLGRARLSRTG